jgi:phosphoribosylamine--glycine ligase
MAANGYPGKYVSGTRIQNLDVAEVAAPGVKIFHAGTTMNSENNLVSAGGRVLGVTAVGKDIAEAQGKAYSAVDQIDWPEGFCRRDIGWRAVSRLLEARPL